MVDRDPSDDPARGVPEAFGRALREAYRPPSGVPAEVQRAILSPAPRPQLARPSWIPRAAVVAAAAAAVLLVVGSLNERRRRGSEQLRTTPLAREDLDGDGKVDVLDAFLLARGLEGSVPLPDRADVDGNGAADQADVEALLALAVGLGAS